MIWLVILVAPLVALPWAETVLAHIAAFRIYTLLTAAPPVADLVVQPTPGPITPHVEFHNVRFRYQATLPDVLHGISFALEPGETVALVGHSGAGKSTCANLLLRLWDVKGGSITVGGHDLRQLPQATLRDLIAYVPQDVYLFNRSVRENIRLGQADATDEQVEEAARLALALDFITELPDGWATHSQILPGIHCQPLGVTSPTCQ